MRGSVSFQFLEQSWGMGDWALKVEDAWQLGQHQHLRTLLVLVLQLLHFRWSLRLGSSCLR